MPSLKSRRVLAVAILPPALIALVCSLALRPQNAVDPAGFNAAADRRHIGVPREQAAAAFSGAGVRSGKMMEDSGDEIRAIKEGWVGELRELRELAMQDGAAALARISQMPVAEEREAALREVCLQLAAGDPALAMNAAWQFQLGRLGGLSETSALEDLARRWAAADLSAAIAWVVQQPQDEAGQRDRIVKGIALAWSEKSPADAARFVVEHMSPDYAQGEAAIRLAGRWAAVDFSGAAAWVELFPAGSIRDRAREELSKVSPTQLE